MKNSIDGASPKRPELSMEDKKIVKSFEDIPFSLPSHRAHLVLVWRKLRSGTGFSTKRDTSENDVLKIKKIIEDAGLIFKSIETTRDGELLKSFLVTDNQKDMEILSRLWFGDHLKDREVYLECGRIFGFPKTAIEAYDETQKATQKGEKTNHLLSLNETYQKLPKDLVPFAQLLFSRAHWQQEVELVRRWAEEIKFTDPALYANIVGK